MAAKRVLIAEDERPLAHALHHKLRHEGYKTTVVYDGKDCLDALEAHAFDVILLDLMMPVMDGFQVLERLRHKPGKPYIIVLSNLSQHDDERRVLALGAKKYFVKSDTALSVIVAEVEKAKAKA